MQKNTINEIHDIGTESLVLQLEGLHMRPWIRRYPFSWIFAAGGRLSDEAYNANEFVSKSKVPKM